VYLAYDIGGTSIKAGVFDTNLELIKKYQTHYFDMINSIDFPKYLIDELIKIHKTATDEFKRIISVGCGVPGVVSEQGVIAVAPNMTGIVNFPIKELMQKSINLPFAVDNDANVAALAELYIGSGKELKYFIYVTLGTGIGGAIICDGKLFKGSAGGAGEIGHIIIDFENIKYDNRPYRQGTVEVLSGRQGILNLADEILLKYQDSKLNNIKNFDVKDISKLADSDDIACKEIIQITGNRIGIALVNSANILDIPNFIIGGGISKSELLLNSIEETLKSKSIPSISSRISLLQAKFQENTGIYGAAVLAKYYSN
jgi:glucokinase